jgi:hypothetical protein
VTREVVLFDAQQGTQQVRVWIEADDSGIKIVSHDVGPALVKTFGKSDVAAFLEVDAADIPAVRIALQGERMSDQTWSEDEVQLLLEKYRGDSTATGTFRAWLDEHGIPYRFTVV